MSNQAENQGKRWTNDDENLLRAMSVAGSSLVQMALSLGRTPYGIQHKLYALGLTEEEPDLAALRAEDLKEKALIALRSGGEVEFRNNHNSRLYIANGYTKGISGDRVSLRDVLNGKATFPTLEDVMLDHFVPSDQFHAEVEEAPAKQERYVLTAHRHVGSGYQKAIVDAEQEVLSSILEGLDSIRLVNVEKEDGLYKITISGEGTRV